MDLRLWELFHLAIPLSGILITQVVVAILFALTVTFLMMGKIMNPQ
jgi:sodium--glutamate symport carrier gltS